MHHTQGSWYSFIQAREGKLKRLIRDVAASSARAEIDKETSLILPNATRRRAQACAEESYSSQQDALGKHVELTGSSGRRYDFDSQKVADGISEEAADEAMMGQRYKWYTDADRRMMARFIASRGDLWDPYCKRDDQWDEFHHMVSTDKCGPWRRAHQRCSTLCSIPSAAQRAGTPSIATVTASRVRYLHAHFIQLHGALTAR